MEEIIGLFQKKILICGAKSWLKRIEEL